MRTPTGRLLATAAAIVALAGSAGAGQVFVTVGSPPNKFTPGNVGTSTQGDFVIWTWVANGHTVTSGTNGSVAGDGVFNSDPGGGTHNSGTVFAWKTDRGGSIPYYCRPHFFTANMTGTIVVPGAPPAAIADFRITEVRFDGIGSNFVEIANLGTAGGNLRELRLSINGSSPVTHWSASTPVAAGSRVTVPEPAGLANAGSAALYAPYLLNSLPYTALATNDSLMVDYVEWGAAAGQPLEDTAVKVTTPSPIWFAGQFAPQAQPGHSIVFCGTAADHGSSVWNESRNPTPGAANDCVDPTRTSTWGRIKTLYR